HPGRRANRQPRLGLRGRHPADPARRPGRVRGGRRPGHPPARRRAARRAHALHARRADRRRHGGALSRRLRGALSLTWALNSRHRGAHRPRLALSIAGIDIRPVTEISMPESVLARARATPGVLAAAGTVEASTFIRAGNGNGESREQSVAVIGFEPGILALAPRALGGASLAGADPTG